MESPKRPENEHLSVPSAKDDPHKRGRSESPRKSPTEHRTKGISKSPTEHNNEHRTPYLNAHSPHTSPNSVQTPLPPFRESDYSPSSFASTYGASNTAMSSPNNSRLYTPSPQGYLEKHLNLTCGQFSTINLSKCQKNPPIGGRKIMPKGISQMEHPMSPNVAAHIFIRQDEWNKNQLALVTSLTPKDIMPKLGWPSTSSSLPPHCTFKPFVLPKSRSIAAANAYVAPWLRPTGSTLKKQFSRSKLEEITPMTSHRRKLGRSRSMINAHSRFIERDKSPVKRPTSSSPILRVACKERIHLSNDELTNLNLVWNRPCDNPPSVLMRSADMQTRDSIPVWLPSDDENSYINQSTDVHDLIRRSLGISSSIPMTNVEDIWFDKDMPQKVTGPIREVIEIEESISPIDYHSMSQASAPVPRRSYFRPYLESTNHTKKQFDIDQSSSSHAIVPRYKTSMVRRSVTDVAAVQNSLLNAKGNYHKREGGRFNRRGSVDSMTKQYEKSAAAKRLARTRPRQTEMKKGVIKKSNIENEYGSVRGKNIRHDLVRGGEINDPGRGRRAEYDSFQKNETRGGEPSCGRFRKKSKSILKWIGETSNSLENEGIRPDRHENTWGVWDGEENMFERYNNEIRCMQSDDRSFSGLSANQSVDRLSANRSVDRLSANRSLERISTNQSFDRHSANQSVDRMSRMTAQRSRHSTDSRSVNRFSDHISDTPCDMLPGNRSGGRFSNRSADIVHVSTDRIELFKNRINRDNPRLDTNSFDLIIE
eukprot:GHVL01004133.1.p1 GENE.GHVL01004133.1~~GHVL01004133.1.p1  ORF type:complete len:896 (+),score=145.99 GHVL01004133.1:397-2688(+)